MDFVVAMTLDRLLGWRILAGKEVLLLPALALALV